MDMIDLFAAARKNSELLEDEYNEHVSQEPQLSQSFDKITSRARISTNKRISALLYFLRTGNLESGYRYSERIGSTDFRETLRIIWATSPQKYVKRRVAFQKKFIGGPDHLFGALNEGNPGTAAKDSSYGEYCIVLKNRVFEGPVKSAYCKYDTLNHDEYWTCKENKGKCSTCSAGKKQGISNDGSVYCNLNWKKLRVDYADHSHRAHLAVIKNGNQPSIKPKKGETEDYIEVCFLHDLKFTDVEAVFFHEALGIELFHEAFIRERDPMSTDDGIFHLSNLAQHRQAEDLLTKKNIRYGYFINDSEVKYESL